jgi:hypothetical protein
MFSWADYEIKPKPQSRFHKIFGAKREYYAVRKGSKYGGHLRHRHDGDLDRATALHWLLHNAHGASLLDRVDLPAEEVADLLVRAAAMHPTEKRKDTNMSNVQSFTKAIANLGEHKYTSIIQKFASNNKLPNETAAQSFVRIFTEDSAQGLAIRKFWQVSKGTVVQADGPEREYGRGRSVGVQTRALDPDEAGEDSEAIVDAAVDDERDALAELEDLAVAEQRRNPRLSKSQAFAKIYTDPANAALAQRERLANRPR